MDQGFRRGFTAAEKTELWDRWQRGESLKAIGRAFGKPSSSIYFQISPHGGIRPSPRRRSRLALTLSEREEISRGIAVHRSARSMAGLLGRSPSTVSREISRNGGYDGYRAALADDKAWARTRRPKRCKLATNVWLRQAVASKLRLNWAPEQIAGWLKRARPDDERYHVSHETIYRSLFVQARGVLKKELLCHLRSKRTIRRSKQAGLISDGRGQIKDIVSIRQRPAAVEDRAVPGHWEGDLLSGSKNSYIATLVERHTRYVMLAKVDNKDTRSVVSALIKQASKLPSELYKSLTWDRGKELTVALLLNAADPFSKQILAQVQLAGKATGIEITPTVMVRGIDEVEAAFDFSLVFGSTGDCSPSSQSCSSGRARHVASDSSNSRASANYMQLSTFSR